MISIPIMHKFYRKSGRKLTERQKWAYFMRMQADMNRVLELRSKLGIYPNLTGDARPV